MAEFNHFIDHLTKEMDNRFDHQDEIVTNLSNIVTVLQNTLKIIGTDV